MTYKYFVARSYQNFVDSYIVAHPANKFQWMSVYRDRILFDTLKEVEVALSSLGIRRDQPFPQETVIIKRVPVQTQVTSTSISTALVSVAQTPREKELNRLINEQARDMNDDIEDINYVEYD